MALTIQNLNFSGPFSATGRASLVTTDPYFKYTTLLLNGNGANTAQNNTFLDSSTNNIAITRNGTPHQGSLNPYGKNWSLYTNGTSSYAYLPYSATRSIGTGDFSIECWINVVVQPANYTRIWSHQSNYGLAGSVGVELAFGTVDSLIQILIDGNSTVYYSATYVPSAPMPWKNKWVHVVGTRQSGTLRIIVDGILREATAGATTNINGTSTTSFGTNSQLGGDLTETYISNYRICIGSVPTLYQTSSTTAGTTIFTPPTTPLTLTSQGASGVQLLLFQDNRFIDNSRNNFAITTVSSPKIQKFGPFSNYVQTPTSYSIYFDGSSYLSISTTSSTLDFGTGDFTIEMWANPSTQATSYPSIISCASAWASGAFYIRYSNTGAANKFGIYWNPVGDPFFVSSSTYSENTWHHVAVTRSGSTVTLWVNGSSAGTGTSSASLNLALGSGVWIGNNASASCNYKGYISNLRTVKGTALYTTAFTPSTIPLTAVANTSLLTCQDATIKDNSTNAFAITANSAPTSYQLNPFGQTISETPSPYTVPAPDLYAGSIYLNGSTDYLTVPYSSVFDYGTGDFTIEAWIYLTVTPYQGDAIFCSLTTGGSAFQFYSATQLALGTTGVAWRATSNSASFPINTWHHVAVSRGSGTAYFWLNGVNIGTVAETNTFNAASSAIAIGKSDAGSFTGYISNLRVVKGTAVYKTAFTPPISPLTAVANTSLLTNFTNSGIYDGAMMNNVSTVGDSKISTTQSKFGGSSMYFDGNGDYLQTLANDYLNFGTGDFTIECWVYNEPTSATYPSFIASITGWSAGASGHRFDNTGYANKFWFGLNGSGGVASGDPFMASSSTFNHNQWYHYALTRSGNTWRMFIDGNLENTQTYSGSYNAALGGMRLGYSTWDGANGYWQGYLDDVRITRGIARYTANFTPPGDLSLLAQ